MGYFPQDQEALNYLRLTGRNAETIKVIEHGLRSQGLLKDYNKDDKITYSSVL